jgi:purine-nucleoside phosphorylase
VVLAKSLTILIYTRQKVKIGITDVPKTDAIVNPVKSKNAPDLGLVAVMAATRTDLFLLCELFNFDKDDFYRLMISRLYFDRPRPGGIAVTGPFVGAPYAVMLLETLIAWGVRKIIFIGWCGAVSKKVKIGDIILPTSAVVDEGTSVHYGQKTAGVADASPTLVSMMRQVLKKNQIDFHTGKIWTTDAVYRETRQQVAAHQQDGIMAVEMELSALYSAANFRQVALAGILVVSDELSSLDWRPGFRDERFAEGRRTACRLVVELGTLT